MGRVEIIDGREVHYVSPKWRQYDPTIDGPRWKPRKPRKPPDYDHPPAGLVRCEGVTVKLTQCTRWADRDTRRCYNHLNIDNEARLAAAREKSPAVPQRQHRNGTGRPRWFKGNRPSLALASSGGAYSHVRGCDLRIPEPDFHTDLDFLDFEPECWYQGP